MAGGAALGRSVATGQRYPTLSIPTAVRTSGRGGEEGPGGEDEGQDDERDERQRQQGHAQRALRLLYDLIEEEWLGRHGRGSRGQMLVSHGPR